VVLRNIPTHLKSYPVTIADEMRAKVRAHLTSLRNQHDRLKFEENEKRKRLRNLEQKISDRDRQDEFTQECVRDGELMMLELDQRRLLMEEALSEVNRTGRCYENILKFCANHSHEDISEVERVLQSRKEQFNSLLRKQRQIEYEIRHLRLVERPELEKEVLKKQQMQETIISKLQDSMQVEKDRAKQELETMNNRQEIGEEDAFEDDDDEIDEKQQEEEEEESVRSADTRVHEQIDLGQFKTTLERMKRCCGARTTSEVYERFVNREKDTKTLESRRESCETRLKALKDELVLLQKEFDKAKNSTRPTSSHQIRELDDQNEQEDRELNKVLEQEKQVTAKLTSIRSGIVHLSSLLGIQGDVSVDWKQIIMEIGTAHARTMGVIGRIAKD